jgi:copper oxidase (laccase) domain-containing protein
MDQLPNAPCDALVTNVPELLIGIYTADCVPILLCDSNGEAVGAVHCGWRGLYLHIIDEAVNAVRSLCSSNRLPSKSISSREFAGTSEKQERDIHEHTGPEATNKFTEGIVSRKRSTVYAALGPCIHKDNYIVGESFVEKFPDDVDCFSIADVPNSKGFEENAWHADLPLIARKQLNNCGVQLIESIDTDTFEDEENFFSYRRFLAIKEPVNASLTSQKHDTAQNTALPKTQASAICIDSKN